MSDHRMKQARADAVRKHAGAQGVALEESFAFGDAFGDVPMLECVGHPVAVNPGRRMREIAGRRGWPIERWTVGANGA